MDRDLGVARAGGEAVNAREIDQLDRAALGCGEMADTPLNRDTRIVCDLRPAARQAVEQRRFAAVRRAHQRQTQSRHS
jgi:hypothetical protein